jgi:hypothetical protein
MAAQHPPPGYQGQKAVPMRCFLLARVSSSVMLGVVFITIGLAVLVTYSVAKRDFGTGTGVCALIWTAGCGICKFRTRLFKSSCRRQEGQSLAAHGMLRSVE